MQDLWDTIKNQNISQGKEEGQDVEDKQDNKLLVTLTKRRREKTHINKIRDEKEDITTNTSEI
jgi:hypothetical protein